MTNEDAIAYGKRVIDLGLNDEIQAFCELSIKALETIPKYKDAYNKGWDDGAKATYEHLKMCEEEQEPCEDTISRQAVNDLISKFIIEIHTEGGRDLNAHTNEVLRQILRNINSDEVLPSVNPQEPMTDTWSIKDVADTLAKHGLIVEQEPIDKSAMMYEIYMEGVNMSGEYQGCWVRFKDIEKIVDKYMGDNG